MADTLKSGITSKTPGRILFGAGAYAAGLPWDRIPTKQDFISGCIGATSGGGSLNIKPEILDVEVDGATVAVKGLAVKNGEEATFEINQLELLAGNMAKQIFADVATAGPTTAVTGVYTVTIGGTVASGDKITVAGVETTLDSTSDASATAAATAVAAAFSSNTTYTATSSAGVVTLTEKSGKEGSGTPTASIVSTSGTVTVATTTAGVAASDTIYDVLTSSSTIEESHYYSGFGFCGKTLSGRAIIVVFKNALCTEGFTSEPKNKENAVFTGTVKCYADLGEVCDKLPYKIYIEKEDGTVSQVDPGDVA